jgi:hypothetical protein
MGAALSLVLSGELSAGSIFMKNGYILQGPIVERDTVAITMGWPNGKVTIQRRFIDAVTFEQEEEKRLIEDAEHRAAEAARGGTTDDTWALMGDPDELPPDLEGLIERLRRADGEGDGLAGDTGSESPLGGLTIDIGSNDPNTVSVGADLVVRPEALLGDRVNDEAMEVSFQPPWDWSVRSTGQIFHVVGPAETNGFSPSINVVSLPMGALTEEEYIAHLKEENVRGLENFELLSERPCEVGTENAYELLGRGKHGGRMATVRQVLFEKDGTLWLISAFTLDVEGDDSFASIEAALKSFEFPSDS